MNNAGSIVLIGWETRTERHALKARTWCQDYGLRQINRTTYIGHLYAKEKTVLQGKFALLFSRKTEKVFIAVLCKSCFNDGMSGISFKVDISATKHFELIQMP